MVKCKIFSLMKVMSVQSQVTADCRLNWESSVGAIVILCSVLEAVSHPFIVILFEERLIRLTLLKPPFGVLSCERWSISGQRCLSLARRASFPAYFGFHVFIIVLIFVCCFNVFH